MLDYLKRHHIGLIALFVALGGSVYAATSLTSNSAGSSQPRAGTEAAGAEATDTGVADTDTEAVWREPHLAAAISAAGQTVLSERTVIVPATAPWISASTAVASGQHLWFDTRSDGRWSGNPRLFPYSDANGLPIYPGQYRLDANAQVESLIGFVGATPPPPQEVSVPIGSPRGGSGGGTDPGFIEIGDTLKNLTPVTSGPIWLRNNDNTNCCSDAGRQIVKVIVTR